MVLRFAFTLLFAVIVLPAGAQDLEPKLRKVVKSHGFNAADLGLVVVDLGCAKPKTVFDLNGERQFIPASVTKLATASTVLKRLGPSFKFQTALWSDGKISDGVLRGDLVLKGGGDPGFVSETMWFLVNEFTRTGVHKIEGDLVVDDTDFDSIRDDPSREPERVDRAYDAPVGAMSFNWNSINVFVRPAKVGEAPHVFLDPLQDYFTLENKAKTVNHSGSTLEISRTNHHVLVRGTIGVGHDEVVAYKNIDDPAEWSGRNLKFFLSQRGIEVTGGVKKGRRPADAKLLAKADSKPVASAVADMLKFSNNYVAEMLTKDLAAQSGSLPANLEAGMKLIRRHLNDIGIQSKDFVLLNPSGLSRKNRMSPRDLANILVDAQKNFPTFGELLSSLPLAGLDGTLKHRMIGTKAEGWVRGKTGSLSGIVSLAGYAGRKDGGLRAFAFIYNGKTSRDEAARHLFDALARELVQ